MFSRYLLLKIESGPKFKLGKAMRYLGQSLLKLGHNMQGNQFQKDEIPKSTRSLPYKNIFPRLLESQFVAPNSTIIGDVDAGKNSSFFFGVILRGDKCKISVGKNTVIQDNSQITNSDSKIKEVLIGNNVNIGTNCYIDGAVIKDNVVIGNRATIHSGSVIEAGAFIAPGSVVPKNTVVPKNQVWVGQPAKYLRNILPEEKENVAENLSELIELSSVLVEETEKSQQDLILDNYYFQDSAKLSVDEKKHLYENMLAYSVDKNADDFGIEGIGEGYGDIEEEGLYRHNLYKVFKDESFDMKFHQDFRNYPDYFRIYNENFKRYDEINRRSENIAPGEMRDVFEIDKLKPERPGAMRAWVSKWDPDFNITFKNVGSKVESNNK